MTQQQTGIMINFGLSDQPDGKKQPAMLITVGPAAFTLVIPEQAAAQVAQAMFQGLLQVAEAARQANGGLIIPNFKLPDIKLNGEQPT